MVRSTTICRASDSLPLAASVDDEDTEQLLQEHKQQVKLICRRITPNAEPRCSIESGPFTLHYLIADNVVYFVITDKSYPRKLAFSYLDELSKEFATTYGPKVETVRKPYAFVGFDTFMSKTARLYQDTRTASAANASGMDKLNDELQDVTRIMTKNMEELLWRGDSLDRMSHLSTSLRSESEKYRKAARNINFQAMLRQYAPLGAVAFILIILLWWRFSAPSPFAPENQIYRSHSPAPQAANYRAHSPAPPAANQISPGSITYTTSTGPDGQLIYHPFNYQTPTGIVSGIQWIPAEATEILPAGAQPATEEFAASWQRGYLSKDEQRSLKDWQKEEEKRRRKEEKEAAKRLKNRDEQGELQKARAMDAMARERRKSFNAGGVSPMAFPTSVSPSGGYGNVYAPAPAPGTGGVYDRDRYNRERKYSNSGVGGLNQQFGDLDIDRERMEQIQYAERERKLSNSALGRPRKYSFNDQERLRKVSGNMGDRPTYAVPGAYSPATGGPYVNPRPYPAAGPPATYPMSGPPYSGASPNMRPSSPYAPGGTMATGYPAPSYPPPSPRPADAYQRSTTPFGGPPGAGGVYPQGHVLAGQPMGPVQQPMPRSRATTPVPGGAPGGYQPYPQSNMGASPRMPNAIAFPSEQSKLEAPQGFSRPINAAQSFTPFEAMKILEMDDILEHLPRMPLVLQTHDVLLEDWLRMTQDLSLAWAGRLPVPGNPAKRSTLAADLLDLWNGSFFQARGVELVLYKGRERRTGQRAGTVDRVLPGYDDDDDDSDETSSSSSESDDSDDDPYAGSQGMYGRQGMPPPEVMEARRRQKEKKLEKKRRRKERKARRKAKARDKKYSLYLTCIPLGGSSYSGNNPMAGPPVGALPGGGSSYPGMVGTPSPHQGLGMGHY
ncbi:hypothetical protein EYR36_006039 [Pleurotus pulmonarius]|nr:hypothetical protein EYR36_006039 [Pleurotus pulmonarius]KAF4600745.1 hypothetical protein EYR38_005390 [Pleurotus pulmonarius]